MIKEVLLLFLIFLSGCVGNSPGAQDISSPELLGDALVKAINEKNGKDFLNLMHPDSILFFDENDPGLLQQRMQEVFQRTIPETYEIIVKDIMAIEDNLYSYDQEKQSLVDNDGKVLFYFPAPVEKMIYFRFIDDEGRSGDHISLSVGRKDGDWYVIYAGRA